MTKLPVNEALLPHASVAVKTTGRLSVAAQAATNSPSSWLHTGALQASAAEAPAWLSNQAWYSAKLPAHAFHCRVHGTFNDRRSGVDNLNGLGLWARAVAAVVRRGERAGDGVFIIAIAGNGVGDFGDGHDAAVSLTSGISKGCSASHSAV